MTSKTRRDTKSRAIASPAAPTKPRLFIGSTEETRLKGWPTQLSIELSPFCDAIEWRNAFKVSRETLANLINATKTFQFAAFLLTPDDLTISKGKKWQAIRDNILVEIGLFMGSIGPERTFLLSQVSDPLKIPTDLFAFQRIVYGLLSSQQQTMSNLAMLVKTAMTDVLNSSPPPPTPQLSVSPTAPRPPSSTPPVAPPASHTLSTSEALQAEVTDFVLTAVDRFNKGEIPFTEHMLARLKAAGGITPATYVKASEELG